MMLINIQVAWVSLLFCCIAGAIPGLFFHHKDWLDGYGSWQRRMIRLGHISLFGIGIINLAFALTARSLGIGDGLRMASALLVVGIISMPLVCYLSAWKMFFRHFFFIPATSVSVGIALFAWRILFL